MSKKSNLKFIIDSIGRTIIGDVSKTSTHVKVKDPMIVQMQQRENGQVAVQLIPYLFREFVADREPTTWHFNKTQIVYSDDFEIDAQLVSQYHNVLNAPEPKPADNSKQENSTKEEPELVKLFDE